MNLYSPSQLKQLTTLVEALPAGDDELNECVIAFKMEAAAEALARPAVAAATHQARFHGVPFQRRRMARRLALPMLLHH